MLKQSFFDRSSITVAKDLIGKYLVCEQNRKTIAYMITETEAYDGPHDKACHASKGRTERTEVMFGPAGVWYVYLIYGMYWMLNVVTDKKEYPSAVLIRGVEEISGPGRLTRAYGVTRSYNGKSASRKTGLWIEDRGVTFSMDHIERTKRIGVSYAGPEWENKPYRFVLRKRT